jgi:hypothetical protein
MVRSGEILTDGVWANPIAAIAKQKRRLIFLII